MFYINYVYMSLKTTINIFYWPIGINNNKKMGCLFEVNPKSWTLNQPFATNVAFGGYFGSNNQPGRFFKGTLSDMIIIMDD